MGYLEEIIMNRPEKTCRVLRVHVHVCFSCTSPDCAHLYASRCLLPPRPGRQPWGTSLRSLARIQRTVPIFSWTLKVSEHRGAGGGGWEVVCARVCALETGEHLPKKKEKKKCACVCACVQQRCSVGGSGEACLDGSCWAVDGVMERRVAGAISHFQTLSSSTLSATCRSSLQRMKICAAQIKKKNKKQTQTLQVHEVRRWIGSEPR